VEAFVQKWLLLAVAASSGLLNACGGLFCDYETDAQCEDPERAQVLGTVTVAGQEAEADGASTQQALTFTPASQAQPDLANMIQAVRGQVRPTTSANRSIADKQRMPLKTNHAITPRKEIVERWRAGEVVVRAEHDLRHHRGEEAKRFADVIGASLGENVDVEIGNCGLPERCLVRVRYANGKELDENTTAFAALALAQASGIRFAERNLILDKLVFPDDEFYSYQWHYPAISLEQAWEVTTGDDNVVGAVIDSGIALTHPDLEGRVTGGADLVDDVSISGDGDGRDDDGTDPDGQSSYHGTHVAGTMAANSDNGTMVSGMNWQGQLLAVRVLGAGGGSLADIIDGVQWAIGGEVDGVSLNPTPADVLNLSLGGPGDSEIMNEQMQIAVDSGALVIVAAGNDNIDASGFTPANAPAVITVAALGNGYGSTAPRASYSNFGDDVEIAAPGGETASGEENGVLSTVDDYVGYLQGTSMASPHVAGLAMLMKSVNRGLTQAQALDIMQQTADPDMDCDQGCGAGQINAYAAVVAAQGDDVSGLSAANVRVRRGETTANVVFRNFGNSAVNVNIEVGGAGRDSITVDQTTATIPARGKVTIVGTIARNETLDDTGSATITAVSDDSAAEARVDWTSDVGPQAQSAFVFAVLLADDGSFTVARAVETSPIQQNAFKLFNLTAGNYVIVGLVDSNGNGSFDDDEDGAGYFSAPAPDGTLCSGEGCGRVTLGVGDRLENADFLIASGFVPGDDTGGRGSGGLGAPCTTSGDCGDGLYCEEAFADFGGYCTTDCNNGVSECPDNGTCFDIGVENEPYRICFLSCTTDADCGRDGYVCDADSTCYPG
jgi:serine protease